MRWWLTLMLGGVIVAGCARKEDAAVEAAEGAKLKVDALNVTIGTLEREIGELQTNVIALQGQVGVLEMNQQSYAVADFDPVNSKGYWRVDSNTGTFLLSIKNIAPYVDGFKVTCNFGNPSAVTYNGFTLKAKWGPRFEPKSKKMTYTQWQASLQEKEFKMTESLRAGSWNPVSFVVSPATADSFGYLELSLQTDQLSLAAR